MCDAAGVAGGGGGNGNGGGGGNGNGGGGGNGPVRAGLKAFTVLL